MLQARFFQNGWLLYAIASLFLTYQMALQVYPGVMANQLMHDLHLDAADLGLMGGSYFWAYTLMQIPAGCFFDQINTRTLLMLAVLFCALSTFGFTLYTNMPGLMLMRFIIGGASAFSFTAVLVVAARCFPEHRFPLFVGITQLLAALGGVIGGTPIAYSVQQSGWKLTTLHLSYIGVMIYLCMFLFFRSNKFKPEGKVAWSYIWVKLGNIVKRPQTWWIALYAFFNWGPITLLAALWGEPFLIAHYQMPLTKASFLIDMIWFGICVAPPIFGYLSADVRWQKPIMMAASTVGIMAAYLFLYTSLPYTALVLCAFLMGVASSAQILTFSMVRNLHASDHVGTAVGFNNMAVVLGGAVLQPLVGFFLKRYWSGHMLDGAPIYTAHDFANAMWIVPLCYAICVLACLKIRFKENAA